MNVQLRPALIGKGIKGHPPPPTPAADESAACLGLEAELSPVSTCQRLSLVDSALELTAWKGAARSLSPRASF